MAKPIAKQVQRTSAGELARAWMEVAKESCPSCFQIIKPKPENPTKPNETQATETETETEIETNYTHTRRARDGRKTQRRAGRRPGHGRHGDRPSRAARCGIDARYGGRNGQGERGAAVTLHYLRP